jgi:hypothetical protein
VCRLDNVTSSCVDASAPPSALESLDGGLTLSWRCQKRSCRFEHVFIYISSLKVSVGVATRFVGRFKRRVLSARVESALIVMSSNRARYGPPIFNISPGVPSGPTDLFFPIAANRLLISQIY